MSIIEKGEVSSLGDIKPGLVPCTCKIRLLNLRKRRVASTLGDATHVQLTEVCHFHQRWLVALARETRKPLPFNRGQLPLVGPMYQQAKLAGEQHFETPIAQPEQLGSASQMVGPMYQPARSTGVDPLPVTAYEQHPRRQKLVNDGYTTLEEVVGFNPFERREE